MFCKVIIGVTSFYILICIGCSNAENKNSQKETDTSSTLDISRKGGNNSGMDSAAMNINDTAAGADTIK